MSHWLRTDFSPALTPNYLQTQTPAASNNQNTATDKTRDVVQRRLSVQQDTRTAYSPTPSQASPTDIGTRQLSDLIQKIESQLPRNTFIIRPGLVNQIRSGLNSTEQKNFLLAAVVLQSNMRSVQLLGQPRGLLH